VSVLDFFGDFVFLEHRRNGQTGIKTIFDHFRNTHARYTPLLLRLRVRHSRETKAMESLGEKMASEALKKFPFGYCLQHLFTH